MGKPFEKELLNLERIRDWGLNQNIDSIQKSIFSSTNKPFYIVGSGGSFSSCTFIAELLQSNGLFAKAITPLGIHQNRIRIFGANLIFISASGKNTDILSSYETAILQNPNIVISITLKLNSPLKKLSNKYSIGKHFEYDLPSGKDGFLATNSLVAFYVLMNKALAGLFPNQKLAQKFSVDTDSMKSFAKKNANKKSFIVLYGGWSSSVAVDLESKFSEAALGNILLSDYRNFGHGRHHWFDKQSKDSVIILLITPSEEKLAEKTISILPRSIPHIKLTVNDSTSSGTVELLMRSFYFVNEIGKAKKIDPGRPGVPTYGRKLYNLKYKTLVKTNRDFTSKEYLAISRKVESISLLNSDELNLWHEGLQRFKESFANSKFGGIIFDYDGTLCSAENRYTGISTEVSYAIIELLNRGFILGIATGRGKSVREDFQKKIPKEYWGQIIIGYYNGSALALLSDTAAPDSTSQSHESLLLIAQELKNQVLLQKAIVIETRPFQLTIKISDHLKWPYYRELISNVLFKTNLSDICMLESSHSCDIVVKSKGSKLNIISSCIDLSKKFNCPAKFVCIGDRGRWPGNDVELLSQPYSLSVDEVSPDIFSCWNLAPAGKKNIEATLDYLKKIKWSESDHSFSFEL